MNNNNRILLITLSNIGDAVMTTPVLQVLHHLSPDAKIDIVCGKRSEQIFKYCPFRGDIVLKNKHSKFIETIRFLKCLRERQYDLIVDLRTDGLAYLLRGKKRCTKQKPNKQVIHAVEQHMAVIKGLQKEMSIPPTKIWLDEEHETFARKTLSVLPGNKWLVIGPGCGGPEKVWPGERYSELVEQCSDLFNAVILVGGQGDIKYAEIVMKALTHTCLNLCGKTDLLQAASILKRASIFIGCDSGLGHIASAVSIPTVSLFGVGSPEKYHPWSKRAVWLKGENQEIRNITVGQVANLVRTHMQQNHLST
jgi:ADP-heptose:LPS heptosyltransferase